MGKEPFFLAVNTYDKISWAVASRSRGKRRHDIVGPKMPTNSRFDRSTRRFTRFYEYKLIFIADDHRNKTP